MRKISENFRSHLDGEVITICNCWRIIRSDGIVLGFTDHDRDLLIEQQPYETNSGFEASQIESSGNLTPDNHQILGAIQSGKISEEDIFSRRYDDARVEHFIVNWSDVSENVLMATYLIGEISKEDGIFRAELKSLSSILDQTNMRRFERRCSADLGDARCKVNLQSSHSANGEIIAVLKPSQFRVSGLLSFQTGWFSGGKMEFTSGANAGTQIEVVDFTGKSGSPTSSLISIWASLHNPISVGDQFSITPGCDKFFNTCKSKFSNGDNFQGFPHMPGADFAMNYANNSDRMDGGPLIP